VDERELSMKERKKRRKAVGEGKQEETGRKIAMDAEKEGEEEV